MKREGRQRGMVRTFPILSAPYDPQPGSGRILNEIRTRPTAGTFTKASSKPTNHSKFTGKCPIDLACKSKDNGHHKARFPLSDLGLVALRAEGKPGGVRVCGSSATVVLDYLDSDNDDDSYYYDYDY